MASKNAADMAAQKAQLEAQKARLTSMQALLVANGLLQLEHEPMQGTSAQALAHDQIQGQAQSPTMDQAQTHTHAQGNVTNTPTRKRHSSQQIGGLANDTRITKGSNRNRFEVLTQSGSYPDRSMKSS